MTDKEKIRKEVEKRYEYWKEKEFNSHSIESEIRMSECKHLLLMLDSLQEEPVSEELEEAAKRYSDNEDPICTCEECLLKSFKAGAKWQEGKDDEEKVLTYKHGFEDCKEQMMAKAIDATIGLPYENKDGGYTHLIDVSRLLPVGNNKIAIIFNED